MAATELSKYKFSHTSLRVKDPQASIKFYNLLGFSVIEKRSQSDSTLYFLAYDSPTAPYHAVPCSAREGVLALTHSHGTETDPNFSVASGNKDPHKGFGHICLSVDHIQAACKRISDAGYTFQKRLEDGQMKSIAFALDPDGYWVELIGQHPIEETEDQHTTDVSTYRLNHTMLRVKSAEASLAFYQSTMGMTLFRTFSPPSSGFTLYFLAYTTGKHIPSESDAPGISGIATQQGLLELTWNHGTEQKEGRIYHSGNSDLKGFSHICITVEDLNAACQRFDSKGVRWTKQRKEGSQSPDTVLVEDVDGYSIQVVEMGVPERSRV